MITPRFNLTQTKSMLTINIRAPYCNLSELDVSVEENKFIFVSTPYYLRLNLPGNILDNDHVKSSFDSNSGEYTFTYQKENNEEFPNLDFITTFLQPKTVDVYECGQKIELLTFEDDHLNKTPLDSPRREYGFALRGGYNFQAVNSEFKNIFKIDPYETEFPNRRELRISQEQAKFDPDHYIADIMDDTEIKEIIELIPPWESLNKDEISFNEKELDVLKDLPNVNYSLSQEQINYCHNSLIEILFAYCYDRRSTFFEGTCESDWTISNISASLSCFDSFSQPKDAIICAYRRSLIYPLYRSFKLCQRIFDDLKSLLKLGNKYIISCLIQLRDIFLYGTSGRYVLNKLFIDDYVRYMMKCHVTEWTEVVEDVLKIEINKGDLGLNLEEIENSINNIELAGAFANLQVNDDYEDSDDTDSCDSESCDSDSTSGSSTSTESDENDLNTKSKVVL